MEIKNNVLGQNIKKYRIESNFSQDQLAFLTGCSQNTISKYERGIVERKDYELLTKIADILQIEFCMLLKEEEENV